MLSRPDACFGLMFALSSDVSEKLPLSVLAFPASVYLVPNRSERAIVCYGGACCGGFGCGFDPDWKPARIGANGSIDDAFMYYGLFYRSSEVAENSLVK